MKGTGFSPYITTPQVAKNKVRGEAALKSTPNPLTRSQDPCRLIDSDLQHLRLSKAFTPVARSNQLADSDCETCA
jgi:hypothetical protein